MSEPDDVICVVDRATGRLVFPLPAPLPEPPSPPSPPPAAETAQEEG